MSYVDVNTEQFFNELHEGVVNLTFEKKDGSSREMNCTLKEIPADKQPKENSKKHQLSEGSFTVFDVDASNWRVVNLSKVIEYTGLK